VTTFDQAKDDLKKEIANEKAIGEAQAGGRLGDISAAVQEMCEAEGYGVVREFVGHGIGKSMHEDPQVPNFGTRGKGPRLKAGMVLALGTAWRPRSSACAPRTS